MRVKTLKLQNFRNYDEALLEAVPGDNLLVGANAQGKTNLLEALYLMSCARSHRTGKDPELIRHGADFYRLEMVFDGKRGKDQELVLFYQDVTLSDDRALIQSLSPGQRKRREIYYQGVKLDRIADLFGLFHAVIFAPEDLMLVKGAPAERRRFLDLLLSKISSDYFNDLASFQRILSERNQLLKKLRDKQKQEKKTGFDPPESDDGITLNEIQLEDPLIVQLDLWTERLADYGASLIRHRVQAIAELQEFAATALDTLSAHKEELRLSYDSFEAFTPEMTVAEISDLYLQRLKRYEQDDIFRGSTSYGPQRDDLLIEVNDLAAKVYASQGQQRSLALALKIAELHLVEKRTEEKPILLLDDVMSELDPQRRERLFRAISSEQVFLTCADQDQILPAFCSAEGSISGKGSEKTQLFHIRQGTIQSL